MWSLLFVPVFLFLSHYVYEFIKRRSMLSKCTDKFILVTGCDSGFGKALVRKLDELGCHVFAACYTQEGQQSLRDDSSSRLITFSLDVSREESVKHAFQFVSRELPEGQGLWGLVNNAGVQGVNGIRPLEYCSRRDFQEVLDVNLFGTIDMTLKFLPLVKQSKGRIVNMGSIAGRISMAQCVPYPVSKYGIEAFSDSLRVYVHQYGIQVSLLEPGFFPTSICAPETIRRQCEEGYASLTEEQKALVSPNYAEKSAQFTAEMLQMAPKRLDTVIDAYVHALFSVHPKKRYSCGTDVSLFLLPLSYSPSCVQDLFIRHIFNKFRKLYNKDSPD